MKHQEIIFGIGAQTLDFDAPEGRAFGAPTISVWRADSDDDGQTEAAITGSPALQTTPNTSVNAASGYGQSDRTLVGLFSLSGVVKRRPFLMTNDLGETEWVEVKEINTAASAVRLRQPLRNAYPSAGCTFATTRITANVSSTWVADKTKISDWRDNGAPGYRARIDYTVGGLSFRHHIYFDLTRYPLQQLVTPLDVDARFPGWIDRLPIDYTEDQGAALIASAQDALRMDARGDKLLLRCIRETDILHELTCARAMLCAAESAVLAGSTKLDALEAARAIYAQRYNQLIREPKVDVDVSGGGAGQPARRTPLWRR